MDMEKTAKDIERRRARDQERRYIQKDGREKDRSG